MKEKYNKFIVNLKTKSIKLHFSDIKNLIKSKKNKNTKFLKKKKTI